MPEEASNCIFVHDWPIHYEKFGTGSQPILMIPGCLGTGATDYYKQISGFNSLDLEKYTLIVIELAGWGRSRFKNRPYGPEIYDLDAECGAQLMKRLGYTMYFVVGWSDGCNAALRLAAMFPSRVDKVVVFGVLNSPNLAHKNIKAFMSIADPRNWDPVCRARYEEVYGPQTFRLLWNDWVDSVQSLKEVFENGFFGSMLPRIRCPVLVLHGDKDAFVDVSQSREVVKQLCDGRLECFPKGGHNLHQQIPDKFKIVVEDFLDE